MRVVSLLNSKGGSAKTSTTFHLSGTLALDGYRVLLVDHDPQASLTQGFFGPARTAAMPAESTIASVYRDDATLPESLIVPAGVPGVDLVPGSPELAEWNYPRRFGWGGHEHGLRMFLGPLRGRYDVCLVDCPPNLQLCSWAALVASDAVVVPLQAEDFGSQGLGPVRRSVEAVRAGPNPRLSLAGYLLSMFDRRLAVHQTYEAMLRERFGGLVFANVVPRSKDFVEAVAARKPLALAKPRSASAKAIRAVAEEFRERVALEPARGRGAA
jgi:chromosome partitioning protein